ncbi:MAG: hypothetical protein KF760_13705 [Candidatus Eremiobacteraeota bacterium]|nr:hypothetical protein [Candidatus Eremiobacteraeota bacterium]MCW5867776.1 hypothetical protein [Candidatus Eremiobacteraeota bacterium]
MKISSSYLAVFLLNFLLTCEFWSLFVAMDDEAVTVLGAVRLLRGELPYRDWDTRHTPGSYFLSAACLGLTGPDSPFPRLLFSLISAFTACLLWWLSRRYLARSHWLVRGLPVFLWSTMGVSAFPILSYHWYGTLTVVAGCLALTRWLDRRRWAAELCGLSLALALWCLQSAALTLVLLTGLAWWRYRPPAAPKMLATSLIASLVLWLPLLPWTLLILQESLFNIGRHLSFNYQPYGLVYVRDLLAGLPDFGPQVKAWHVVALRDDILVQVVQYLSIYPVAWLGVLVAEWRRRTGRAEPGEEIPAWGLLLWLLVTRAQQSPLYISFLAPIWLLTMAQLLARWRLGQWAAGCLAGLEVVGWGLRAGLRREAFIYPIQTRAGLYYSNNQLQAAQLAVAAQWLQEIPPGTPVLAYPFNTSFYTLFHLNNPIRPPVLQPLLYGEEDYAAALRDLKRERTGWLLIYRPTAPQHSSEFDRRTIPEWERRIQQLTQDYEPAANYGNLTFYRLKVSR